MSCNEEFLTETPLDRLVDESFFKTTKHIEQSIHPLYALASRITGNSMINAVQLGADDLLSVDDLNKVHFEEFDLFDRQASNERSQGVWAWSYFTIHQANFILDNVDRANASDEVKNLAKAQARFFRAYAYFWITRLWGPVPLVITSNIANDVKMGEVEEIYQLILSDIEFASNYLPEANWDMPDLSTEVVNAMPELWKGNKALVNKGWLYAFRSNVYLTMAGWPLKQQDKYEKAALDAKYIIDNAPKWEYGLLEDYQDLWLKDNNFHNEGIVWFGYHPDGSFLHLAPNSSRPIDEPNGIMRGWNDYMVEIPFFNDFPEGYRKKVTFTTGWYTGKVGVASKWVDWKSNGYRHPYIAKWRSTDTFPYDSTWSVNNQHNSHHRSMTTLRFAQVLLIYAESQARANGSPNAQAIECLNMVRRRARHLDVNSASAYDYNASEGDFIEAVINEKGWELTGEADSRWYDLVRLERVKSTLDEIISYRTDMRNNPNNPYYPLHKAVLVPGDRAVVPTELTQLHWFKYPEIDVLLSPEVFKGYGY
jgi:hypothetical protein